MYSPLGKCALVDNYSLNLDGWRALFVPNYATESQAICTVGSVLGSIQPLVNNESTVLIDRKKVDVVY